MAVIINEFEVVAEPPPAERAKEPAPPAGSSASQAPTPAELQRVLRRLEERAARVRAD